MMPNDNEQEFVKLADELAKTPTSDPHWNKIQDIIQDLRNNEYHDFANEKYATPKMQMIADFTEIGRQDIVDRVKDGDFDQ
jgi:hypothetical protein